MEGVILFVDDKVNDYVVVDNEIKRTLENQLFEELRRDYPVLAVKSLDLAKEAIRSIGSFSAIILDWVFDSADALLRPGEARDVLEGLRLSREGLDTFEFLQNNDFYSLVYVFSNEDVKSLHGKDLVKKYRKRIKFKIKGDSKNEAKKIAKDILKWKHHNQKLAIPSAWTKTINQSVQKILLELAYADENWIRELGRTAADDGVSGENFIVEVLQNLLAETLVQDQSLIEAIRQAIDYENQTGSAVQADEKSVARLFRRIFYTKLADDSPVMTGDICKVGRTKYGIIVTPECDIKDVIKDPKQTFELLTFFRDSFVQFLSLPLNNEYSRTLYSTWDGSNTGHRKLEKLRHRFNNGESVYHILPSFPFSETDLKTSIAIDLSKGCERCTFEAIKNKRTYKLNSPFIQQLRQRYISHFGRVGSPSLPLSLRNLNLK